MSLSSTEIWVGIPLFAGLLLSLFSNWRHASYVLTIILSLLLSAIAWLLPFNQIHTIGNLSFKIIETYEVFDQSFILLSAWRPIIGGVYLLLAIYTIGAYYLNIHPRFSIYVTVLPAFLLTTFSIRPYHYAAIPILAAVFLSATALIDLDHPKKIFRMLTIMLAGSAVLLFSGPLLAGVEVNPGNLEIVQRGSIILGLGLWLLLSIFPFHHWIPMVMETGNIYTKAFLILLLQSFLSLYALTLLDHFAWLREAEFLYTILFVVATITILLNSISSIFESNPGRLLSHAILLDTGFLMAAIGLGTQTGFVLYFAMMVPRFISVLFWSGSIQWVVQTHSSLSLSDNIWDGLGKKHPTATALIITAFFSFGGLPGFASFPLKLSLLQSLLTLHPAIAGLLIIGIFGILFGATRIIYRMVISTGNYERNKEVAIENPPTKSPEIISKQLLNSIGTFLAISTAIIFSIFPQWFIPIFTNMPDVLKFTVELK